MSKILSMKELVPSIYEAVVEAPEIAKKARAAIDRMLEISGRAARD